ncbi:MAG: pyridoxamine 5'-phosphate oxidase family protein [Pseudonocardia sp.]|nr:pyridoxamine 5'-phosphate oxidase family protein [Pseudonocardia sp.]
MIPPELAHTMERYRLAYLITVNADARAHVAVVTPAVADGRLSVTGLGKGSRGTVAVSPAVTLLWPPAETDGHSLVVDGVGTLHGDDLMVAPTRAVLHRPAERPSPGAGGCQADCIELPVQR